MAHGLEQGVLCLPRLCVNLCSVRLSARTPPFHGGKRGSIPLPSTTICPGGGMADTAVLEAAAERRESSSLSWGTKFCRFAI